MGRWKILDTSDTVLDFRDDLNIEVSQAFGTGMPTINNITLPFGLIDGAEFQNTISPNRVFTLQCTTVSTTLDELHIIRKDLINLLKRDRLSTIEPVKIQYTDGITTLQLECFYEAGLELGTLNGACETFPLRFLSVSPFFTDLTENSTALDIRDTATLDNFAHRDVSFAWSDLGLSAASDVKAIIYRQNGNIVIGTSGGLVREFDGISWTTIGDFGDVVRAIVEDANADLYVGGDFTLENGVTTVRRIAKWDGAVWTEPDIGLNNRVRSLAVNLVTNDVYMVGNFTFDSTGGGTPIDGAAVFDGTNITEIGGGINLTGFAVVVDNIQNVFVGGSFTADGAGAGTFRRCVKLTGATWTEIGTGFNGQVSALAVDNNNLLYIGGNFTADGPSSITYGKFVSFNGVSVVDLGAGITGTSITDLAIDPNTNNVFIVGTFTSIGGISAISQAAVFNGQIYTNIFIDLPGSGFTFDAVATDGDTLSLGYDSTGTGAYGGTTTITNSGTAELFPIFEISGPGDFFQIENATTGKFFSFSSLTLNSAETVTIDLTPGTKTVISDTRGSLLGFFDSVGNFGSFSLLPGDNDIIVFVNNGSASGLIKYTFRYWSLDGVT